MSQNKSTTEKQEVLRAIRLIGAAPDMLAMLKRLSTISTLDPKWDAEILELIDKAEGKS